MYKGNIAGIVIKNVTAPEPSKWTSIAKIAVPIVILIGSFPTFSNILLIIGWKVPASVNIPKNKIANINIVPVGAIDFIPSKINLGNSNPNPPIIPKTIGTTIRATTGFIFLHIITTNKTITVKKPNKANIDTSLLKIMFTSSY